MEQMKVNVLGTEYTVEYVEKYPEYLSEFDETADALCNSHNRAIYVKLNNDKTEQGKKRLYNKNLRHEIIHAFLYESGLSATTYGHMGAWAENEEIVDWFAIQSPKIIKLFQQLDIL